ncbi:hypothetical protein DLAC_00089 [Tieghemostelium lacteum]|uniref:Uncharacterized protein n=1 Tax=Tieghemostelium lacteum TaxID=361077 RepID=A0A152A8U6_TIELA|nr:hypothetical protein DLAC_00089 [Tieghemostelium lacteum]|eukprot:KYR02639.1 hypothetical protein DLAC_00089 [Tieghemostelium lacteum]
MSDDESYCLTDIYPIEQTIEIYKYTFFDNINLKIKGQELQNVNTQPSTGLLPWPASSILANYISKYNQEFKDKNILELGSGVGIGALVASKYTDRVMITDGDDKIFDLLDENLQLNQELFRIKPIIKLLLWGENQTLQNFEFHSYDTIIGSDLIYVNDSIDPLFYTVDKLLSMNSESTFYLSFLDRKNHLPVIEKVSLKYKFNMISINLNDFIEKPISNSKMFKFTRM